MSGPIINPLWIYLMSISSGVKIAFGITAGLLLLYVFTDWLVETMADEEMKKPKIKILILGCVFVVSCILTPSSKTVMAMAAAQNITYEVVDETGKIVKNSVDYIFDKVIEVKGGGKDAE